MHIIRALGQAKSNDLDLAFVRDFLDLIGAGLFGGWSLSKYTTCTILLNQHRRLITMSKRQYRI